MASPDRFDGIEIDRHQARFAGTIDLDQEDADRLSLDTEFMSVIVCRVSGAGITETATGDLVRTNRFKIQQFTVVHDRDLQEELYQRLPALYPPDYPQLTLPYEQPPSGVTDTGEVIVVPDEIVQAQGLEPDEVFTPPAVLSPPPPAPAGHDTHLAAFLVEEI